MKDGTVLFLKGVTVFIGIVIALCCIWSLPNLAREAAELNPEFAYLRIPVLAGIYMTAVPFYFALYQAFHLLTLIEKEYAFSEWAVKTLGNIKVCAGAIIGLYALGMAGLFTLNALHPGIALIGGGIMFTTLVIFFFAAVLQGLLSSALKIKSENDLTV